MVLQDEEFTRHVTGVLARVIDGFESLIACDRLSGGANQETYCITVKARGHDQRLAFRRAAGGDETQLTEANVGLETEAKLFEAARSAGVPGPDILYVLNPNDHLGHGFFMSWLDGETIGYRIVNDPDLADIRPSLAATCGHILARIHSIDTVVTGLDKRLEVLEPRAYVERTWATYQALDTPQPMIDFTAQWLLDHLPENPRHCLVHNDFRNGNLIIDKTGVKAVLDWEIAHIGDPLRDLGWICTNSWRFGRSDLPVGGFGEIADLLAAYEATANVTVDRDALHFWNVFGSFWWAIGCLRMAQQYRDGPDRTVERPAIGRRSSECQADCVNLLIPGPVELLKPARIEDSELPQLAELLGSVKDYLATDVSAETHGRTRFLARVAANSLSIVERDLNAGVAHRDAEYERLRDLLQCDDSLSALRWRLVQSIRDRTIELDNPDLTAHLRTTVINQLAIDQPRYSALNTALEH